MVRRTNKKRGFTIIEIIVTLALYAVVMLMIMGVLFPAVKFWARYADKEGDAAFLAYAQELLTEKIRCANEIYVYDVLNPIAIDDSEYVFFRPDYSGYYDLENDIFKRKFYVERASGSELVITSAPRKPKKGTMLTMYMSKLDTTIYKFPAVSVELALTRNGEIVSRVEFSAQALNASGFFVQPVDKYIGKQAFYID